MDIEHDDEDFYGEMVEWEKEQFGGLRKRMFLDNA